MTLSLILIFLASISSTAGNIFLKLSRIYTPANTTLLGKYLSFYFILAIFFYIINLLFFAKALDKIPVAIGYPILAAGGFAFLALAARFVFNEHFNLIQFFGLILVILGIVCLAWTK